MVCSFTCRASPSYGSDVRNCRQRSTHVRMCHHYDRLMGRWEPGARGRLTRAALELYLDPGYEQTTVADIAARAGVTERTFFRHFADKREVLFDGSAEFQATVLAAIAAAPATASALAGAVAGMDAAAGYLQ